MVRKQLSVLLKIAEEKKEQARLNAQLQLKILRDSENSLAQLREYRSDYEDRFNNESDPQTVSIQQLQNYLKFRERINEAIDQQTHRVNSEKNKMNMSRDKLMAANQKKNTLDTLSQKISALEQVQEAKREQKILDEMATQKFIKNKVD